MTKYNRVEPVENVKDEAVLVEETPIPEPEHTPVMQVGVVANCVSLNVRERPLITSDVLCRVEAGAELIIDSALSSDNWFKVCTACGLEGFCVREFVELKV